MEVRRRGLRIDRALYPLALARRSSTGGHSHGSGGGNSGQRTTSPRPAPEQQSGERRAERGARVWSVGTGKSADDKGQSCRCVRAVVCWWCSPGCSVLVVWVSPRVGLLACVALDHSWLATRSVRACWSQQLPPAGHCIVCGTQLGIISTTNPKPFATRRAPPQRPAESLDPLSVRSGSGAAFRPNEEHRAAGMICMAVVVWCARPPCHAAHPLSASPRR